MKSFFLLLLLLLMAGCQAKFEMMGCKEGWVEFTCKILKPKEQYQSVAVVTPRNAPIKDTEKKCENKSGICLFHVNVKQLAEWDAGMYQCNFSSGTKQTEKLSFADEKYGCQNPFVQTAYRNTKTTITCDFPGHEYNNKFLCKENKYTCVDISSNKPPNRNTTHTESNRVFSESISNVSSQHAGVYWCGVEPKGQMYRTGLKKIQLKVERITTLSRSPTVGQDFTYWCVYPVDAPKKKFICKGEDPSICEPLASTQNNRNPRFSMTDRKKGNITITLRKITANDTGTYWCGAKRTGKTQSNPFFNRLLMTVVPPPPPKFGGSVVVIAVAVCAGVMLLLLFVLILIIINRRLSCSNNTRNGATPNHIGEDYIYEEIPDRVSKLDSGNRVTTIYAAASLPTSPSSSLYYSTINFEAYSSDKADGEAVFVKHRSACDYSNVNYSQSPVHSVINAACRSSQDDLYSTVNKLK